jgi:glycosyltransferase involved in cell wall biosynthesis
MREKMEKLPKVSIITPSLNQGHFIERTILSVLNQNYPNFEYIVMDGGSTDNTKETLEKYKGRLIWKSEQDKGQSAAINKGFRLAIGEIVAWLNSDDTYKAGTIRTAVICLLKNPQVDMVFGNGHIIDEEDHIIGEFKSMPMDLRACLYHGKINIFQPSVFFRKSVFEKIGPLDEKLHITMDIDYWIRMAMNGLNIRYINHSLANLRWHQGAKTFRILGLHRKYHLLLLKKYGAGPFLFFLMVHIVLADFKRIVFGDKKLLNRNKKVGGQIFTK